VHAAASGLAILAHLEAEDLDRVLGNDLSGYTSTTIVDRDAMLAEVEGTRERGYAVNDASWWRPDVCAVAAAVTNASGRPVAAVAISVPASRFGQERARELGGHVLQATAKISGEIQKL
jgi:DNA-binding IclR family transcriptional regulator